MRRRLGEVLIARGSLSPADLALFSKILDAVLLDHLDNDLERITRINSILEAGTRIAGPEFIERLNRELGHDPGRHRLVHRVGLLGNRRRLN